jgi:hypothetical protein
MGDRIAGTGLPGTSWCFPFAMGKRFLQIFTFPQVNGSISYQVAVDQTVVLGSSSESVSFPSLSRWYWRATMTLVFFVAFGERGAM